ncbi:hypothetical protein MA16_Dca026584 [Dendrobium catenatum]|uniref:Uncharacterized protein n=1 Tax=Dendrobium catenatum TaxID=906689 RepID=A0A2I0V9W8_9ASPA|nr:hypothetical protein MA16_Dca026584 [Dendrobium catenatum]
MTFLFLKVGFILKTTSTGRLRWRFFSIIWRSIRQNKSSMWRADSRGEQARGGCSCSKGGSERARVWCGTGFG